MKSILTKSTGGEACLRGIGLAAGWHGSRVVLDGSHTAATLRHAFCALFFKPDNQKRGLTLQICIIHKGLYKSYGNLKREKCVVESFVIIEHPLFSAHKEVIPSVSNEISSVRRSCSPWLYVQFGMYVSAFVNLRNRCSTCWFWTHGDV